MTDELMILPANAAQRRLLDRPDEEIKALVDNLVGNVSFGMNANAKRIALSVNNLHPRNMSAKQRDAIIRIAYRFRRQLSDRCRAMVAGAKT